MELFLHCLLLLAIYDGLHCFPKGQLEQQDQYNQPPLQQHHKPTYPLIYGPSANSHIPLHRPLYQNVAHALRYPQQYPIPQIVQFHPNLPQYPRLPQYQCHYPFVPQQHHYQPQYPNLPQHQNHPQQTDRDQVFPQYPQHYLYPSSYAQQLPDLGHRQQQLPNLPQYSRHLPVQSLFPSKSQEYLTGKPTTIKNYSSTQSPIFQVNLKNSFLSENPVLRKTAIQQNYLQNSFSDNQVSRHSSQPQQNLQKRLPEISISRVTNQVRDDYQNSSSENPISRQTSQSQHNLQKQPTKVLINLESSTRDNLSSSKDATTFEKSLA